MWPNNFSDWWALVGQRVYDDTLVRLRQYRLLTVDGAAVWRVEQVVRRAARAVFDRADERQAFAQHFLTIHDFRRWAVQCGYLEALKLLPAMEYVRPWLEQLPPGDRQLLMWAYLDQFDFRTLAKVVSDDQSAMTGTLARDAVLRAYRSFCVLLRQNQYGTDDDRTTFPVPPILVGAA